MMPNDDHATIAGRDGAPARHAFAAPAQRGRRSVADFYRGKTVNVLIGVGVGGEYDLQARLVARHIGKHIPGNPNVVPQNMTGAGGINMANYLFTQAAARRHLYRHARQQFSGHAGGRRRRACASTPRNSTGSAPSRRWSRPWRSGTPPASRPSTTCARRRSLPAPPASGAITYMLPLDDERIPRHQIQDRHRLSGRQPDQPRDGARRGRRRATTPGRAGRPPSPTWVRDKQIIIVAQAGPRAPDLDAPSVETLAKTPDDRALIELVTSGTHLGRPMATTPDVPADRLKALRDAYRATMADPEFRAEADKANFEVDSGVRRGDAEDRRAHHEHTEGTGGPRQAPGGVRPVTPARLEFARPAGAGHDGGSGCLL